MKTLAFPAGSRRCGIAGCGSSFARNVEGSSLEAPNVPRLSIETKFGDEAKIGTRERETLPRGRMFGSVTSVVRRNELDHGDII